MDSHTIKKVSKKDVESCSYKDIVGQDQNFILVANLIKSQDGIAGRFVGDEVVSVLESQQGERLSGSFPRGPVIEG
jgi:hypothetical protein